MPRFRVPIGGRSVARPARSRDVVSISGGFRHGTQGWATPCALYAVNRGPQIQEVGRRSIDTLRVGQEPIGLKARCGGVLPPRDRLGAIRRFLQIAPAPKILRVV